MASTMRMLRAPNCANTPYIIISGSRSFGFPYGNNGARTHDLPLVRRALSQLSYVSIYNEPRRCSTLRGQVALMENTSKNYQRILEFKLSNHAGRLSPFDTDIISQSPKNDKGENSDYYTDKKKVDRLQQPYQRAFTPEETQKIIMAYQSGKASYELGTEFNCSKTTIVKLLKQQGVPLRKSGRTRAKVDDKKVIRMYKEMHTIKEISKNLNVDTQVISRCLKENGVKLRSRWDYPEK